MKDKLERSLPSMLFIVLHIHESITETAFIAMLGKCRSVMNALVVKDIIPRTRTARKPVFMIK